MTPQFNPSQQAEALGLIETCAWGSMHDYICDTEAALRLAMESTSDDYLRWENEFRPALEDAGYDEFSAPADLVAKMSDEEKRAYVAGLLRALALAYGVNTELGLWSQGLPIIGEESPGSPAALLRGLNDISWLPTGRRDD
jgi:hypothetical protein